jgi:enamine deaminase RidA (YjgF/YER057c/UK114 family)
MYNKPGHSASGLRAMVRVSQTIVISYLLSISKQFGAVENNEPVTKHRESQMKPSSENFDRVFLETRFRKKSIVWPSKKRMDGHDYTQFLVGQS